jgi:hypothetical protein
MRDASKFGLKHTCYKCGCKFYDLNRPRVICPKCGADQAESGKSPSVKPVVFVVDVVPDDEPDETDETDAFEDEVFPDLDEAEDLDEDIED